MIPREESQADADLLRAPENALVIDYLRHCIDDLETLVAGMQNCEKPIPAAYLQNCMSQLSQVQYHILMTAEFVPNTP